MASAQTTSSAASPADPALNLARIDTIVEEGIRAHSWPGAVVLVGHNGRVIFRKPYGQRALEPQPEPMTPATIFDMASLTKCLSTATAIMQLYEQGRLRLDDPVAKYLPDFAVNGKEDITIRQLLTHYSGLPADLDLQQPWTGEAEGYRRAMESIPVTAAGVQFRYSDINFIVLGRLVEKLSGMPLNQYYAEKIAAPLGLVHSNFLPAVSDRANIAPTQYDEEHRMLRGVVHDPTSRRMGGVAGHAGLFSTADDVSIYAQNLLDRLAGRPSRFPLEQQTLIKMTTPEEPATGTALRGFGWDIESPFSSNRGTIFPVGSFGHTGFTGTSLWMDPASNTYVIVLANAVHPNGPTTGVVNLRSRIADVAALSAALAPDNGALAARLTGYNETLTGMRRWPASDGDVRLGIDVLEEQHFTPLASLLAQHHGNLRVGLLTNQTGLDSSGRRTLDIFANDAATALPGLHLTTIFSPEHGITGVLDQASITNAKDAFTGLPIVSLYGPKDADRRPPLDTLRGLDAVVIDLQDVGVRYYTYEAVLRYFLEAAAQTRTAIVVLDRPNPLSGSMIQGPISDIDAASYVDVASLPVRHGLTLGELARWLNGQLRLDAPLTVVAMQGWQRGDWFDSTSLTWVNPSPNLHGLTGTTLYPALGLIEGTNISVGRGTSAPFERLGSPWIDGRALAHYLNHRDLAGVRFMPVSFTPAGSYPYAGELCSGVEIELTGRNELDAPELGIELAAALKKLYGEKFSLGKMNTLLGNKAVLADLEQGRDPERIAEDWQASLAAFTRQRAQYLLY
jgi:uncharacterized protein YbbC (DUF1343 family)/CubicO group peptidase (beta-lactamase class C family)